MKVKFKSGKCTVHKLLDGHVALILPPKAAQYLADIHASIAGSAETSRRKWASQISDGLKRAGYNWADACVNGRVMHSADMDQTRRSFGFTFLDNPEGI